MEDEGDSDTNHSWSPWNNTKIPRKETGGNEEELSVQTTALLKSARILRGVLESRGDLLSLRLQ